MLTNQEFLLVQKSCRRSPLMALCHVNDTTLVIEFIVQLMSLNWCVTRFYATETPKKIIPIRP